MRSIPKGTVFNKWTTIGELYRRDYTTGGGKEYMVLCKCQCGARKAIRLYHLTTGGSRSCKRCAAVTHGLGTPGSPHFSVFKIWMTMNQRCFNPNTVAYYNWGGRGITVCDRWRNSYENFLADMGPRPPGMTLDRINNDGNYEPGNCRWATRKEQNRNRRGNVFITAFGETRCISEWAEISGIDRGVIRYRILHGHTPEQAVTGHPWQYIVKPVSASSPD